MIKSSTPLQDAVWAYYSDPSTTIANVSKDHNVPYSTVRRAWLYWSNNHPASPPLTSAEILLPVPVRPKALQEEEENLLTESIHHYANNQTPLTKQGVCNLTQHFVNLLPAARKAQIPFQNGRPSIGWVARFLKRHPSLKLKSVKVIEQKRLDAVTKEHVSEHISRLNALYNRYHITNAEQVFNVDETGISIPRMIGRSLRKEIGGSSQRLVRPALKAKGNIDHVTIMSVVSASVHKFKPAVIFPGKQPRFRRVKGRYETVHQYLPDCYVNHRDPAGVYAVIFHRWAQQFIEETKDLPAKHGKLILIFDGYAAHIQFETLQLFKNNNIVVNGLPAHTSHILQPLDVGVVSSFKAIVQREVHEEARSVKSLNVFDISDCIFSAYESSDTNKNITSGFHESGSWNKVKRKASINTLEKCFVSNSPVTLATLVESFDQISRTLVHDAQVEVEGTIRIKTEFGAHLTASVVIDALRQREAQKQAKPAAQLVRRDHHHSRRSGYTESSSELRHLISLAPKRAIVRQHLDASRAARRALRRAKAVAVGFQGEVV